MTISASEEFDPADTLPVWLLVDEPTVIGDDVQGWASIQSEIWRRATLGDEANTALVTSFLAGLAIASRPAGFTWRLVFVLEPGFGATIVDIAVLEPLNDEERAAVLGHGQGAVGHELIEFNHDGRQGHQAVRFDLNGDTSDLERTIAASASIVVTRDLDGFGRISLLARIETGYIDAMATALQPLQYLLCSDELLSVLSPD